MTDRKESISPVTFAVASFIGAVVGTGLFLAIPFAAQEWRTYRADRAFAEWARQAVPALAGEVTRLQGQVRNGGCS